MKKKLFIGLSFVALATGGHILTDHRDIRQREMSQVTDFQLDNIEALSRSEVEIYIPCIPNGYICGFLRPDAAGTYRWIKIPNMTKI